MANNPKYEITMDVTRKLLTIRVSGYWNQALLDDYKAVITAKLAELGSSTPELRVLVDVREHGVQAQHIANQMQSFLKVIGPRVGRVAVIVDSALQKMQTRRINPAGGDGIFGSEDDATSWLLAG
ncbi:hypothetical protein [Sphingomonas sp. UYAg733]